MMAKNKEDTVIVASSSPTIIKKESSESGASIAPAASALANGSSGEPAAASVLPAEPSSQAHEGSALAFGLVEELSCVRVAGGSAAVLALAAAAAQDSQTGTGAGQLPTVATQYSGEPAISTPHQHAPLNTSSTMKQAPHVAQAASAQAATRRVASGGASGEFNLCWFISEPVVFAC